MKTNRCCNLTTERWRKQVEELEGQLKVEKNTSTRHIVANAELAVRDVETTTRVSEFVHELDELAEACNTEAREYRWAEKEPHAGNPPEYRKGAATAFMFVAGQLKHLLRKHQLMEYLRGEAKSTVNATRVLMDDRDSWKKRAEEAELELGLAYDELKNALAFEGDLREKNTKLKEAARRFLDVPYPHDGDDVAYCDAQDALEALIRREKDEGSTR